MWDSNYAPIAKHQDQEYMKKTVKNGRGDLVYIRSKNRDPQPPLFGKKFTAPTPRQTMIGRSGS